MTCEIEVSGPSYAPDAGGKCERKAVAICSDCGTSLCQEHVVWYNDHPYCEGCGPVEMRLKED